MRNDRYPETRLTQNSTTVPFQPSPQRRAHELRTLGRTLCVRERLERGLEPNYIPSLNAKEGSPREINTKRQESNGKPAPVRGNLSIRRLSENPKIGAMDHAEIVRDSVAEPFPLFGHGMPEEFEDLSRNSLKVL